MANEIGFSTIYPGSGLGSAGPIGATGATGANQTVRGSTGATGLDSNYITSVFVNQETGKVEFTLSDGTGQSPGILKGATGIYAGVTASSLGSGISVLKGVCGGITLDFYNFRTDGLLGITYSTDGAMVFTISANSGAGGISPSIENNRIVYAQSKTTIMSTDLIPEASTGANRVGNNNYGYVNFGGETAGRNVVTDVIETSLSVGPIERGEFVVNISDFYIAGVEGITLDLSRATVYNLVTPIGIKAFTTNNIGNIPDGQVMSVTLIVHGEDVWNFPEDVVFDAESKPIFYPGVNILHMWKTNADLNWYANFTARAIGVSNVKNPGVRGSCCYFDVDGTKHCDDYVTQTYCTERSGNFEGLIPCDKNSCLLETETSDGICCTEGRCVSDLDPSLCQIIGGYFISGITCGYGKFPDDDADNRGDPLAEIPVLSGICFNTCKLSTICCKDGKCLGQLTRAHCDLLEGTTVDANNCNEASCCDHILAPGACCTQTDDGYECTNVDKPYDCNTTAGGIYMGKNTKCPEIATDTDICCTVANRLTCYKCTTTTTGSCNCGAVSVNGTSCQDEDYFENSNCDGTCDSKTCYKCDGTICTEISTDCGSDCPVGYTEGACVENVTCQSTTCYKPCVPPNIRCDETIIPVPINGNTDCLEIGGEYTKNVCNDCPPPVEPQYAACFWCFPHVGTESVSTPADISPKPNEAGWLAKSQDTAQAPFRSVFSITQTKATALDAAVDGGIDIITGDGVGITLPAGLSPSGYVVYRQSAEVYYTEVTSSFANSRLDTQVDEPLRARGTASTRFRCYYVGSYEQKIDPVENRISCLTRYGYTTQTEQADCQLCDPIVNDITYQTTSDINSTRTLDKIEPYQAIIKAGLHAPFPPIWGRITYVYGKFNCNSGGFNKQTTNLRLLSFIDRKNMMHSFRVGTGKYWLENLLSRYDSSDTRDIVLKEMFLATEGSIHASYNVSGRIPTFETQTAPPAETCLDLEEINTDQLAYDPQRLGGDFYYGINFNNYRMLDCEQCLKGWVLPGPSDSNLIAVNAVANNPGLANSKYYPAIETLNTVGERYFVKTGTDESNYVRGIFGRNLRYNLDSFRSSTVFYNTAGDKTMKESDSIAIPIAYVDGYSSQENPCNPSGGIGGGGAFCEGGGGGCAPCECFGCGTNPLACPNLCPNFGNPPGGDSDAWSLQAGLIAPSTVTLPTPFKVQIKKSQITTKRVYITPGICVDMLCPDCYSYESC